MAGARRGYCVIKMPMGTCDWVWDVVPFDDGMWGTDHLLGGRARGGERGEGGSKGKGGSSVGRK